MTAPRMLSRPVHDWEALRARMRHVFDAAIPEGVARGAFERQGEYSAWLVRRGWAKTRADGVEVTARPGEWLFCFARRVEQDFSASVRLLSVRIENHWPRGEPLFEGAPFLVVSAKAHPRLERLARCMLKDIHMPKWIGRSPAPMFAFSWKTHSTYFEYLRHQRHLHEWMEEVAGILIKNHWTLRIPQGVDPRLAGALNAIDLLGFDERLSGGDLARRHGLTLKQANRLCRKSHGMSLLEYWEARRVEQARRMLGELSVSIKETALFLGFRQLSHFSVWFKRHAGRAPREYARNPEC